jgi:DNA-binding transcriptional LysR family regulator
MNAHHLELFYHVAKSKGVSRAARQMSYGIQQPSVSAQVNALERDLGVTLYERRPFRLTRAGEELFEFIEPFFGRMDQARERVQGGVQFRMGASPIVFRDYLPPVIEAVRKQFRRINLILRALNQPELIEAIEQDELDLVISLVPENLAAPFSSVELIQLPLILLVPKRHPAKTANDLWSEGSITESLISLAPKELICQQFQQTLAKMGLHWLPKIEMDSLELIERYVEMGYGVGLSVRLPDATLSSKVRALALPEFPPVKLGVIYRRQANPDDRVRSWFLEAVKQQALRFKVR